MNNSERETLGVVGYSFIGLGLLIGLGWLVVYNDYALYRYFAPKRAAVERQVFEESKSFNQGTIQELQNMQFEYAKANPEAKVALASIILHRAADYPEDKMPSDLREFISKLRAERTK